MIEAGLAGFFGLLFLRGRSQRVAVAAALMGFATITTILAPAGAPLSSAPQASLVAARPSDIELFGKPIPTVWLQTHLWHGANDLRWWDYATWLVYLSHFFATLIVAAVLWTWAHDRFARFATMSSSILVVTINCDELLPPLFPLSPNV